MHSSRPARWILPAAALCVIAGPAPRAADAPGGTQAIIESEGSLYRSNAPIEIRFSIWNSGAKDARISADRPLTRGFTLLNADGQEIKPASGVSFDGPKADTLPAGGHFGIAFDLTRLYPALREGGTFRLNWRSGSLTSNQVALKVVAAFDPAREYQAKLTTDEGDITIDFYPNAAPLAVQNFIDLAYAGFYDGTKFYSVTPDRMIAGGDRVGDGSGTPGYTYSAENTDLEMVAGTVAMIRSGTPPVNGSQFFILAAPRPEMNGHFTVIGQVIGGLENVLKASRVPTTGPQTRPPNRPVSDLLLRQVTIIEKTPARAN